MQNLKKIDENLALIEKCYVNNFGLQNAVIHDDLHELSDFFPAEWFERAVKEAFRSANGKPNLKYVTRILERWAREGLPAGTDVTTHGANSQPLAQVWAEPPEPTARAHWDRALAEVKSEVSEANFKTWFSRTQGLRVANGTFFVGAPNRFTADYLSRHQLGLIERVASGALKKNVTVELRVMGEV